MPKYILPRELEVDVDKLQILFPNAEINVQPDSVIVDVPDLVEVPLLPVAQVRADINEGKYQTDLIYPAANDLQHGIAKALYLEDVEVLQVRFRADAYVALEIEYHPKRELLYNIAVDEAGGDSLMSRFDWMIRLAPLLND